MARYAQINDVNMWYDQQGDGPPLVLLHGGFTDSRDFTGNLDALAGQFRVYLPERRGHGHTADVPGPLTLELMARDTTGFLEKVVGGPARLVGYSAGASVALRAAVDRPDLVDQLVLVSAAYHRDGLILKPEAGAELPPPLVQQYAEVSPDGPDHLPEVVAKVARALEEEPGLTEADLARVGARTLVMAGDDDIVTLEHTVALYRALRQGELAVVPGTSHLLLFEKPALCTQLVTDFLTGEPPATLMPLHRAG